VTKSARHWSWRNVPIPEAHLAFLILGALLQKIAPLGSNRRLPLALPAGWFMVLVGLLLSGWAVRSAGEMDIQAPERIIRSGPYAFSRNPMYLAWTSIYLGIAWLANVLWLVLFFPLLLGVTHFLVILPEERELERRFGDEYRQYQGHVRRYI
jgi:protein-S-isoprenylcysteine O-methyltransferase Ste14